MIDLRRFPDRWRRCDVAVRDSPLALALAAASLVPSLHNRGTQLGDLPGRPFDALTAVVIAVECLPLVVRRRWPAPSLTLVAAGFAVDQVRAYHLVAGAALPIALLSAGAHQQRHRLVTLVLLSAGYVPLAIALDRQGSGEGVTGFVTFFVALAIAWSAGAWLRQTRAAEAERRRHVADATRAAERTRIARELHDVVTHHVTAMVVQVESACYLAAAPERLEQTLSAVADTGRHALTDLRGMLNLLDPGHRGTAADVRALVERARRAGQPVLFTDAGGAAAEGGAAGVAVHRVVQEALTNALKHDHGATTTVEVRHGGREITVEVSTDGTGTGAASPGGGRGLDGLRDRVAALGGGFDAGPRPGGGFEVRARIPVGDAS
ncbi:sensor histidine kinase [Mangrovihabitans endophyticus]|uniref:histidine kinase n=1 Tax=Mangrovihabitans endophyticus TaxID=1751298 RepID=A0A8J3BW45_9ACTN|nr:histidine kinase [Mangrovihabitans endophyticus]GGK75404.1 two-component sensor histidine kinase [Mangrovihabitans endophyticus]